MPHIKAFYTCMCNRYRTIENSEDLSLEDKYTAKKHWNGMFKNALPM